MESMPPPDLRNLRQIARKLFDFPIDVSEESLRVRWSVEDQHSGRLFRRSLKTVDRVSRCVQKISSLDREDLISEGEADFTLDHVIGFVPGMIVGRRTGTLRKHDFHQGPCLFRLVGLAKEPNLRSEDGQRFPLTAFDDRRLLGHEVLLEKAASDVIQYDTVSHTMSRARAVTKLSELRFDVTQRLILDAALEVLEHSSVGELTVRAAAAQAGISERTIFRYFATRDEFLDAVAAALHRMLDLPPHPTSMSELLAMPGVLYRGFEAKTRLVKAALHSELFERIVDTEARRRWMAIRKIIDQWAPRAPERRRKIAAANIRYFLGASTWHYYRFMFRFSLEESIDCAESAIREALEQISAE
jgi:tetracycline repressor-like protein